MIVEEVKKEVCEYFGITEAELVGRSKYQLYLFPRMIAISIIHEKEKMTAAQIMPHFNRHRTTFNNVEKVFNGTLVMYPEINNAYQHIKRKFIPDGVIELNHRKTYFHSKGINAARWQMESVNKKINEYERSLAFVPGKSIR
jgi:hypothetical protein